MKQRQKINKHLLRRAKYRVEEVHLVHEHEERRTRALHLDREKGCVWGGWRGGGAGRGPREGHGRGAQREGHRGGGLKGEGQGGSRGPVPGAVQGGPNRGGGGQQRGSDLIFFVCVCLFMALFQGRFKAAQIGRGGAAEGIRFCACSPFTALQRAHFKVRCTCLFLSQALLRVGFDLGGRNARGSTNCISTYTRVCV